LIFALQQHFEGGNELKWLSVDLQGDDFVVDFRFQFDDLALSDLERFIHSDLHLPHVTDISQSNYFYDSVTKGFVCEVLLSAGLPQPCYSSTPVINIEKDDIFVVLNIDLLSVDLDVEIICESHAAVVLEQVDGADLGVDEFVAELGEEELGVLIPDVVEVLAYLGVQTHPHVVVDRELPLLLPTHYGQFPTVQQLVLARFEIF
jgi:hypothetical protein